MTIGLPSCRVRLYAPLALGRSALNLTRRGSALLFFDNLTVLFRVSYAHCSSFSWHESSIDFIFGQIHNQIHLTKGGFYVHTHRTDAHGYGFA